MKSNERMTIVNVMADIVIGKNYIVRPGEVTGITKSNVGEERTTGMRRRVEEESIEEMKMRWKNVSMEVDVEERRKKSVEVGRILGQVRAEEMTMTGGIPPRE